MRRGTKTGGKPAKSRGGKAPRKRRNVPRPLDRENSVASLNKQVARLLSELRESLEQQTATSEVLSVISSSPGELEPVFEALLRNATRICEANYGTLFLREGEALRVGAHHGSLTKAWDEHWRVGMLLQPDPALQAFQTLSVRAAAPGR